MAVLRQALIIGGSRGIGYSIASKFAKNGYNLTVMSRNCDHLLKSIESLKSVNPEVMVCGHVCNISSKESIKESVKKIDKSLGSIDVLVNAAAINFDKLLVNFNEDLIQEIIETNLNGIIFMCKSVLKQMIRQRKGSIVNIGSVVGIKGNVGQTIYCASKAGLIGFTKSLAKEVAPLGITANLIAPGFIKSEMTSKIILPKEETLIPLKRMGSPEEVADAVFFLANASYITGEVLLCDGGLHLNL